MVRAMSSLSSLRVLVAGGGAVGSAVALAARRAGAEVTLADPAALGDNASGVAAGMLAPAFEAVLDPVSAGHFDLYRSARELWPAFAAGFGAEGLVQRCGALWVPAEAAGLDEMLGKLERIGARGEGVTPARAVELASGVAAPVGAAFTDEDWRLDAHAALAGMRKALLGEGGVVRAARLTGFAPGRARLSDNRVEADVVVLASGLAPLGFDDPPAELGALTPIKGQILRAPDAGPRQGPVVRGPGVYIVPGADGPWIGATMQAGAADRAIDPDVTLELHAAAAGLFPALAGAGVEALAGVRAATPDGLPLVGPCTRPGVLLALGARRNGWLLAPMIAEAVVGALAGRDVDARLAASRFVPVSPG